MHFWRVYTSFCAPLLMISGGCWVGRRGPLPAPGDFPFLPCLPSPLATCVRQSVRGAAQSFPDLLAIELQPLATSTLTRPSPSPWNTQSTCSLSPILLLVPESPSMRRTARLKPDFNAWGRNLIKLGWGGLQKGCWSHVSTGSPCATAAAGDDFLRTPWWWT